MNILFLLALVSSLFAALPIALDLDISASTAESGIVIGSSADVSVATIEFTELRGQRVVVTKLTVLNCLVGGDDGDCTDTGDVPGDDTAINSVTISYADSTGATETQTSYFVSGETVFTGLDLLVPCRRTVEADLWVDTGTVDGRPATSGDQFALVTKAFTPTDFAATTPRGLPLTGRNVRSAAEGEIMTLTKTKPTISLTAGSPSGAGIPGRSEVFRFDIAANSHGYVGLDELLVGVVATDLAGSGWNSLANLGQDTKWALYNLRDMSTPIEFDVDFYGSTTELEYVQIYLEDEIAAGSTTTYALYADTTGASAANDDTIFVYLPDEAEADDLGLDAIYWSDDSTGVYYDGEFVNVMPLYGGTITF